MQAEPAALIWIFASSYLMTANRSVCSTHVYETSVERRVWSELITEVAIATRSLLAD